MPEVTMMTPQKDTALLFRGLARGHTIQFELCLNSDLVEAGLAIEKHCAMLAEMDVFDSHDLGQIRIALEEAAANAIIHGNLEIDNALRERDYFEWMELVRARPKTAPYCDRKVVMSARLNAGEIEYVIDDEGRGFAAPSRPAPDVVTTCGGRGLKLMRAAMDRVSHNRRGNRLTMVKRRHARTSAASAGDAAVAQAH